MFRDGVWSISVIRLLAPKLPWPLGQFSHKDTRMLRQIFDVAIVMNSDDVLYAESPAIIGEVKPRLHRKDHPRRQDIVPRKTQ